MRVSTLSTRRAGAPASVRMPEPAETGSTDPDLSDRDDRNARMVALLASVQDAPEEKRRRAEQRVVMEYLDVADAIANRYRQRPQDHGDVRQVAYVGLVKAVQRFDPSRGGDIVSFAVPTISGEIKRYFRDCGWVVRPPRSLQELDTELRAATSALSQRMGREPSVDEVAKETRIPRSQVAEGMRCAQARQPISLDMPSRLHADGEGATFGELLHAPADDFSRADRNVAISLACRDLSPRDRKILRMRFVQDCTQDEIARECHVTQMQISRLLTRILRDLRGRLSPELLAA